jgi:hypothetical protein
MKFLKGVAKRSRKLGNAWGAVGKRVGLTMPIGGGSPFLPFALLYGRLLGTYDIRIFLDQPHTLLIVNPVIRSNI